jgi:hypothetical protein
VPHSATRSALRAPGSTVTAPSNARAPVFAEARSRRAKSPSYGSALNLIGHPLHPRARRGVPRLGATYQTPQHTINSPAFQINGTPDLKRPSPDPLFPRPDLGRSLLSTGYMSESSSALAPALMRRATKSPKSEREHGPQARWPGFCFVAHAAAMARLLLRKLGGLKQNGSTGRLATRDTARSSLQEACRSS